MAQQYPSIPDRFREFIGEQKIFFVASAAPTGRINLSPKGMDSLRVLSPERVVWLNLTGSGNETSAHILEDSRMTLMFAAFEGKPLILRLYGHAQVIHRQDPEWNDLYSLFSPSAGARQIFDLEVDLVQSSCGWAVPFFEYGGDRELLKDWTAKKGPDGIEDYWREKNQTSIDGKATYIVEKS